MWELDYKKSWALKNWCFWTVVLEKTLESPLDCKEIKPIHSKGNQSWKFIRRTDAEAEALILWPPDAKSWLIRKDPDAGKDQRQKEKGMKEDEMVRWHHQLNDMSLSKLREKKMYREALHAAVRGSQRVGHDSATEQQQQQCSFLKKFTLSHMVKIKMLFWAKVKILIHSKNIYWLLNKDYAWCLQIVSIMKIQSVNDKWIGENTTRGTS